MKIDSLKDEPLDAFNRLVNRLQDIFRSEKANFDDYHGFVLNLIVNLALARGSVDHVYDVVATLLKFSNNQFKIKIPCPTLLRSLKYANDLLLPVVSSHKKGFY